MRLIRPQKFIALFAASICSLSNNCIAAVTNLPAADRTALEHPSTVQMLFSTKPIPSAVKSACASVIGERRFWLAEPGKAYNETCVWDNTIPGRRLIWAARLPEHFVIHYESGGRAHGFHVLVVRHKHSAARVIWSAAAIELKNYGAFIHALRTQKLDDTLEYGH